MWIRQCDTCKEKKELKEFRKRSGDGPRHSNTCRVCEGNRKKVITPKQVNHTSIPVVKKCSTCGLEKDITLFPRRKAGKDGYRGQCKACYDSYCNVINKRSREKNKDKIRERRQKKWEEDKEGYAYYWRTYHKKNSHKRVQQAARYQKENKEKMYAHRHLKYMQKKGKAPPRLTWCQLCGKEVHHCRVVAHHADYNHPLSVVYLCTKHHSEIHKWLRDRGETINQYLVVDLEYTSLLEDILPTLAE